MENETPTQKPEKKRKWLWIILGIIVFIIIIAIAGGGEKKESVGPTQVSQPQISQEQQVKVLVPVKQLINKTPIEIEAITGQKLEVYGKKPSGKLMEAGFKIGDIDVWTVYSLVETEKVKYNSTILFEIYFENLKNEDEAWQTVGFTPPPENKAVESTMLQWWGGGTEGKRLAWIKIPEINPFDTVKADYIGDKICELSFYFLTEEEEIPLYEF